jgi:HD-like signal output (HDOD) protein
VLSVANDPNSGAADLRDLLETDASLSARVLRVVNSSAYALRTKITNLQQSIAYLGLKQVRNLAMTASVSELFAQSDSISPRVRSTNSRPPSGPTNVLSGIAP